MSQKIIRRQNKETQLKMLTNIAIVETSQVIKQLNQ